MEERLVLGCLVCASSFLFAAFACWSCLGFLRGMKRRGRLGGVLEGESSIGWLLRNGVRALVPVCERLRCLAVVRECTDEVADALMLKGANTSGLSASTLLLGLFLLSFGLGCVVGESLVTGVALGLGTVVVVVYWSRYERERTLESCREDIPEALRTMQACFSVGHSLSQTFSQVSKTDDKLLSSLFSESSAVLKSGGTVHESLECLRKWSQSGELSFLATALEIQHRTGSSIQQVLDVTRESIEDDLEMSRSLRTQTAQARLSARIVTAMPFALVALFSILSEGFLTPFFESVPGMVMLGVALLMQVAGVLIVRNMLNVEVA